MSNFSKSVLLGSALGLCFLALAPGCSNDKETQGPQGQTSSEGVCADECLKACDTDNQCDTADGELCCDFGEGKACVDAQACPRFCEGDNDCDIADGEACLRTTLAAPETVCTDPGEAVRLCESDATCEEDEVCCTLYKEPVCLKADRCPQACDRSSDCDTDSGEVCCTTLQELDSTLDAAGLCIDPAVTTCPTACDRSSDCDTQNGELCCNGLCATSCVQTCKASSDCDGQVCCLTTAAKSAWTHDIEEPGYDVPTPSMGGTGGTGGSGSGGTGPGGGSGGSSTAGSGGTSANCESCSEAVAVSDFTGLNVCPGTSAALLDALTQCSCVDSCGTDCVTFCDTGTRDQTCDSCIALSCSEPYGACLND